MTKCLHPHHTGAAPVAAQTQPISASPEFVDHKQARALFGLKRSHLYQLVDAGFIRSVSLRQPGKIKGRRLFVCQSIRDYLARCAVPPKGHAAPSRPVAELAALVARLEAAAVTGEPLPPGLNLGSARAALAEAKAAAGKPTPGESHPAQTVTPSAADEVEALDTAEGDLEDLDNTAEEELEVL